ncbi:MAG: phytanoyl-CoA dioxygenase family protein [Deltaproteobacteria bacterium]|nr:phytanoyl-CoA dioxygenase family protein [Deltaproteobacteria bacterium]
MPPDALPALDERATLTTDAAASYRRDGFAVVRGLATPDEIACFRPAIVATAHARNFETRPLAERGTYGRAFLQTPNLWQHDDTVRHFVFARRFARVAAELMGVRGVRLYHDQALFKEPHGGLTPWHQDQIYWPLATTHTITMWMPLVDLDADMGIMHFARGSHAGGALTDLPIGRASQDALSRVVAERGFAVDGPASTRAGDATFHAGWTLHGAPPNSTERTREVMTVIYYADGTRVGGSGDPTRVFDLAAWLPGCREGDVAASAINPLLCRLD